MKVYCTLMMLFLCGACLAQETVLPEECASPLKLSLTTDWYPYVHSQSDAPTSGIDVTLLRRVLSDMGCELEIIHFPERRTLFELELGAFDVGLGASRVAERELLFHYSIPYRQEINRFAFRAEDQDIAAFTRFQQLIENDNVILINLAGWYGEEIEKAKREFNGFVFSDTVVKRLKMLSLNRVDAVVDDELVLCSEIARGNYKDIRLHPMQLSTADIHFIFNKQSISARFVSVFDRALKEAIESGVKSALYARYLKPECSAGTSARE
ncbi:ABC transporter substrate-binding protein [Alteromonas sediminis]|uniref:ABC transporter substrate-binding protein n=1 Tax=Alteromonas sediminis TaxID=2259342 RepID=A0A3N5ZAZ9_9ALTE|nr:ABC transporter substrate-binding protein [Alteromonas sediminis]RPJ68384.1 ABC transporter substrate-binding protein [Alteromonas sediminis]